jgi:hypothetical protein
VERPRLLLIPEFTELEWTLGPQLAEWADVASYDAPGVGDESLTEAELEVLISDARRRRTLTAERGLEEMRRRGWESCVVVADSSAVGTACRLASMRPEGVEALALGHAALSLDSEGPRAPINEEVRAAMQSLSAQNREEFARHALTQLTGGSYDEEHAERIVRRVPMELLTGAWLQGEDESNAELIGDLDLPLLFVKHEGCLMYTDEGFDDVVAAFPRAETGAVPDKPSVSREFGEMIREFCQAIPASA